MERKLKESLWKNLGELCVADDENSNVNQNLVSTLGTISLTRDRRPLYHLHNYTFPFPADVSPRLHIGAGGQVGGIHFCSCNFRVHDRVSSYVRARQPANATALTP